MGWIFYSFTGPTAVLVDEFDFRIQLRSSKLPDCPDALTGFSTSIARRSRPIPFAFLEPDARPTAILVDELDARQFKRSTNSYFISRG
jgi:hypothetical protein